MTFDKRSDRLRNGALKRPRAKAFIVRDDSAGAADADPGRDVLPLCYRAGLS
jgi:hypothetical protein